MTSDLQNLREILNTAIDTILTTCSQKNADFPSLDSPAQPSEFTAESIRNDPNVAHAIKLGVAAASQLIVTLQSPMQSVIGIGAYVSCILTSYPFLFRREVDVDIADEMVCQATLPANVAVVERTHVAEIIRQYGPEVNLSIVDVTRC